MWQAWECVGALVQSHLASTEWHTRCSWRTSFHHPAYVRATRMYPAEDHAPPQLPAGFGTVRVGLDRNIGQPCFIPEWLLMGSHHPVHRISKR